MLSRLIFCALFLASMSLSSAAPASAPQKEDWSTISLLKPLPSSPPKIGERDQCSTFTRDLVRVQWRENDPIYLYVMLPKNVVRPPVILYLYTFDTDTNRFLNEKFDEQLTAGGIAAVGFASALMGHRYHDRAMTQWFVSELQEALATSTHDVQMILNYLATRNDLDMSRVGMFGEGSGASIAILAATADRRIRAIDLLNPWGVWPVWLARSSVVPDDERARYTTPDFLKKLDNLEPASELRNLNIPIRLQYINEGSTLPELSKDQMKAAAPPQTKIIPSDQALAEYRATSGAKFLDWLKYQLK